VAFWYAPAYFERIAGDVSGRAARGGFRHARLPALRPLASLTARAAGGVAGSMDVPWEELGVLVAARVAGIDAGDGRGERSPVHSIARVTEAVRTIARHPGEPWTLTRLARGAGLSPYHFVRMFRDVTGVTPHQFILRTRLREAAARAVESDINILDIALDCGFGDVSNFNRAFRSEFGVTPGIYRSAARAK
jgi:AraC-like DNA-binding protein